MERRVKLILLSWMFLFSSFAFCAQSPLLYVSDETDAYIDSFFKVAIEEMYNFGIPASITLAQGILESGSGKSDLSTIAHNHFGIKCTSDYVGERYLKDDDKKDDCFRVYEHAEASFRDHSLFLVNRSRYAFLFNFSVTDYRSWAIGLKEAGYATNPNYPQLLIDVIQQNKLYEYDRHPERYVMRRDGQDADLTNRESFLKYRKILFNDEK